MHDVLQFIEQLLGAADTERRYQHGGLALERLFDDGLQTLALIGTALVIAITIGTFPHDDLCATGRLGGRKQRRMRRAQVPGEYDTPVLLRDAVEHIRLDISRAEDMAGALQTDPGTQRGVVMQGKPGFEGQGNDSHLDEREVALDLCLVATDANLKASSSTIGRSRAEASLQRIGP